MNTNEVLAIQNRVFILTGGVDDLHSKVLIPVSYDLAECVLNGGIVGVYEMTFDVLHRERAFACVPCEISPA